jgi:bifunctional enzyme CysN/CysC
MDSFVITDAGGAESGPAAIDPAATDLCILVVDVRTGLTSQVRRQAAIAGTIGVRHLVLAVNKLDLVGWDRKAFRTIAEAFQAFIAPFEPASAIAIPLSALHGDNVAARGTNTPWYAGPTLLSHLESVNVDPGGAQRPLRLPIQSVSRPDPDHRHYTGTIASGTLRRGDQVQVAVSGVTSMVDRILVDGKDCEQAVAGDVVAVVLASHIDVAGGDVLVQADHRPQLAEQFAAHLAWLSAEPLFPGRDYTLKQGNREVTASVTAVKYRIDIDTMHHDPARTLKRNEIGACTIAAAAPLAIDDFADFPQSGRFVLAERYSGAVIAAGTVDFALRRGVNVHIQPLTVSKSVRASLKEQEPCIVWFTGLSGAGKSTIANLVEGKLSAEGFHTCLLDGDNIRHGLNKDLGFTDADRVENIRRVGEVAKLFVDAGLIVLCSFISPFRAERAAVRGLVDAAEYIEIYVKAPLEVCESRDPKGLYAKSRSGRLPNFTGIDSPYEPPENPDLVLDTTSAAADALAQRVTDYLQARGIVARPKSKRG